MIEVSGMYKGYENKKTVLKNINFQVEKGTIHGLIGHNGCGKTTLIKCLTGIYKPDQGLVLVNGEQVYDNPRIKECIGYVADSNQLFPTYRVSRMVDFMDEMYESFSKSDFEKLNEIFKVNTKVKIKQLSKGQQMRLAFMLTLARHPQVMVLDEPTSGLDVIAKKNLLDLLVTTVEEEEMTVIISSHHLQDLEKICDTLTLMKAGKVAMEDDTSGVTEKIKKYQVVFPNGAPKEVYHMDEMVHISNMGSVYTIILKEEVDGFEEKMKSFGSILTEEMECGLEEAFIYLNEEEQQ